MKAKVNETASSVNVDYEAIPYKTKYSIDVIEFDAEVSITTGFEIDC